MTTNRGICLRGIHSFIFLLIFFYFNNPFLVWYPTQSIDLPTVRFFLDDMKRIFWHGFFCLINGNQLLGIVMKTQNYSYDIHMMIQILLLILNADIIRKRFVFMVSYAYLLIYVAQQSLNWDVWRIYINSLKCVRKALCGCDDKLNLSFSICWDFDDCISSTFELRSFSHFDQFVWILLTFDAK